MDIHPVIAANRFGLGARPGDLEAIGADYRDWLTDQITVTPDESSYLENLRSSREVLSDFQDVRQDLVTARRRKTDDTGRDFQMEIRDVLRPAYRAQAEARYLTAVTTEQPFRERLVHFWSNHFAVSADKPPVMGLAGSLENEVIRPGVGGHFVDMLLAVEAHPAMILYLDNQASIGPNSRLARRGARRAHRDDLKLDINENLGREILELHTLGVDGGYSQEDVTSLSLALTGWSVGGGPGRFEDGTPGEFHFRDEIHEPGARRLLNKTYGQSGIRQGEAMLRDLARHPATAQQIATKLVRHFVADEPPPAAVNRVSMAFLDNDGFLPPVYKALVNSPEAWEPAQSKFKTPHEFVISGVRALGAEPKRPRRLMDSTRLLGQPAYRPGSPAGWSDQAADWDGADALMKRIQWAGSVAQLAGNTLDPMELGVSALGATLGDHTRTAIRRAESRAQGLALLLVSPEFLRR